MDTTQFREDAHRLLDIALDLPRVSRDDRELFDEQVRAALSAVFTAAQMKRLEDVLDGLSSTCYLEARTAANREARTEAFAEMNDDEVRTATGGSLLGTLAFRPRLRVVETTEGSAA